MKLLVVLPIILAIFCFKQINCDFLTLDVSTEDKTLVVGSIDITLKGDGKDERISFHQIEINKKKKLKVDIRYLRLVDVFVIEWVTDSNKKLKLNDLLLRDMFGKIIKRNILETYLENGETKEFIIAN